MVKVVEYWMQKSESSATVLHCHAYGYTIKFQEESCITHINNLLILVSVKFFIYFQFCIICYYVLLKY